MAICLDTGSTPVISIIGVSTNFIKYQSVDMPGAAVTEKWQFLF